MRGIGFRLAPPFRGIEWKVVFGPLNRAGRFFSGEVAPAGGNFQVIMLPRCFHRTSKSGECGVNVLAFR